MEQARERLADAQKILGLAHPAVVVNTAYYAMLNAARAVGVALSRSDQGDAESRGAGPQTAWQAI
jgi:uncharacterized protein (UPF0332 family)